MDTEPSLDLQGWRNIWLGCIAALLVLVVVVLASIPKAIHQSADRVSTAINYQSPSTDSATPNGSSFPPIFGTAVPYVVVDGEPWPMSTQTVRSLAPEVFEPVLEVYLPQCPEDEAIRGTGEFDNGRWSSYECGPAWDDFPIDP